MEYSFEIIKNVSNAVENIIVTGKEQFSFLDVSSIERELRLAEGIIKEWEKMPQKSTGILLLGVGTGTIIKELAKKEIPTFVVDFENIAIKIIEEKYASIAYTISTSEETIYAHILEWQLARQGISVIPLLHPFHKKLHKELYTKLFQQFRNNVTNNIWKEMRTTALFVPERPIKVLIIPDYYCMTMNVANACTKIGIEVRDILIPQSGLTREWYAKFLKACIEFRPDFILTFNNKGIEESAQPVLNAAEVMNIPIASWFVDSPDILIGYETRKASELVHIFLWERTRVSQVQALGYKASYLPLAADPDTFYPVKSSYIPNTLKAYKSPLLFLGATGVTQGSKNLMYNIFPYTLHCMVPELYYKYVNQPHSGIKDFLEEQNIPEYNSLPYHLQREFALYLFFFMHTERRVQIMRDIMDLKPVIAGDEGWRKVLPKMKGLKILPVVNYILDLTCVYQLVDVNLNITSPQMKNAVNQRVFDVPMSNSFVLTDNQPALSELFEIGKEIICYNDIEELKDLAKYYINTPHERKKIAEAGRKRVLQEHTYEHRMRVIVDVMKKEFS